MVIGVLAILGGILANGQNIAFLISLAFAVAASANLPSILYTMYWKRFNTRGSVWSIYAGLVSSIVLIVFSPSISGSQTAMLGEAVDFAWFPLTNPALISVPLAFLAGWPRHHHVAGPHDVHHRCFPHAQQQDQQKEEDGRSAGLKPDNSGAREVS